MTKLICLLWVSALVTLSACQPITERHSSNATEDEGWAVTAWGQHFEIFAEAESLQQGSTSLAFTHVTTLADFSPLVEAKVSVVLVNPSGRAASFSKKEPTRAGIFSIDLAPEESGEFDLVFRIETPTLSEDIPAGRVLVGEVGSSGGLVQLAPSAADAQQAGQSSTIDFLKEQQWRTEFATSWVSQGVLNKSVLGPARVEAAAGGEVLLTSPVDGVVSATPWPYPGYSVESGNAVFRVTPRIALDRSLAELGSNLASLQVELNVAHERLARLEGLDELGATSQRELGEGRALVATLENRLTAATQDLATARTARQGKTASSETVAVRAPFAGQIAEVHVTPGQAVAAETLLGRLVRARPLWLAVALRPEVAADLEAVEGISIGLPSGRAPLTFRHDQVRRVSLAPTVDPQSGTVAAFFEIEAGVDDLPIGSRVEAEILLASKKQGVVLPETSLIDDGGVTVVFLQGEGESFSRVEVEVLARQSGRAMVEGIPIGARFVERGGNAIRRATLVAGDVGEGHVH